jgi:predicted TIM-barrel fold metal-dependent hydrolase
MTAIESRPRDSGRVNEPVVLVSCDTHVGPRLEDMRDYCEQRYHDDFDAFVAHYRKLQADPVVTMFQRHNDVDRRIEWNLQTAGHHDIDARHADGDGDGVAAGVIFHASLNGEPMPFQANPLGGGGDRELEAVGQRIFNRWQADVVAGAPDREIALVHVPLWDLDATLAEMRWAKDHGFRGINFPAMRGDLPDYNLPHWDPLWAAAEDLDLVLDNHGGGSPQGLTGPAGVAIHEIENGEFFGRRLSWWLIFTGVFERHPRLKLVLTEQPGTWFTDVGRRLDSVYFNFGAKYVQDYLPLLPSEYLRRNVFIGGSFLSHAEVVDAVENDYVDNVMWGSDYPHPEGTYLYPGDPIHGETGACNRNHLRMTFAGADEDVIRKICGENAARVFGLDFANLGKVAEAVAAPSPAELSAGLDFLPDDHDKTHAFRIRGPWS